MIKLGTDPPRPFRDFEELEHAPHMGVKPSGGSNYTFADGSARYLRYGKSVSPLNLLATATRGGRAL